MRSIKNLSGLSRFDPPFNSDEFYLIVKNKIGRSGSNFILGTASRNFEHDGAIRFFLRPTV